MVLPQGKGPRKESREKGSGSGYPYVVLGLEHEVEHGTLFGQEVP